MMPLRCYCRLSFGQSTLRRLWNIKTVIVVLCHFLALILNFFIISYVLVRKEINGLFLLKLRGNFRFLRHNCRLHETA